MRKIRTETGGLLLLTAALLWPVGSVAEATTLKINCNAKETIGKTLKRLKPGDTLVVSGTCHENVEIPAEVSRITLDGQKKATINAGDSGKDAVTIRGRGITIRGFTITGGRSGIQVELGGEALIDGNTIQDTGRFGIGVNRVSFAVIVNNTIRNAANQGIAVGGGAFAFIGFRTGLDKVTSPNLIENNGAHGITLTRSSSARIVGNTIRNNKLNGVNVGRASQADISDNSIEGNGGDGVNLGQNSAVSLGIGTGTGIFDLPNSTASNNGALGIRCASNSTVDGRLGTLNGSKGVKDLDPTCVDNLRPTAGV